MAVLTEADFREVTQMGAPTERIPVDLSTGGLIVVVLAAGKDLPTEYGFHPLVKPVEGDKLSARQLDLAIPANAKLVIFSGRLKDRQVFTGIHAVLKRRRVAYLLRDNDMAVEHAIKEALATKGGGTFTPLAPAMAHPPQPPAPATKLGDVAIVKPVSGKEGPKDIAKHGSVKALLEAEMPALLKEEAQMPVAEIARRLFRIAQGKGITTTLQSLQQAARVYKRTHGVGERPASLQTKEERTKAGFDEALSALDAATATLKAMRDSYIAMETENKNLKAQLAKAKEAFDMFRSEVFES